MAKYFYFFLFCTILPRLTQAQTDKIALRKEYVRLDSICERVKDSSLEAVVEISKKMAEIGRKIPSDTAVMKANLLQGQAYDFLGQFDLALAIYYETLKLADDSNNCYFKINVANQISKIHQTMLNWEKSREFASKAKQTAIQCGMFEDTIPINFGQGLNLFKLGQRQEAIQLITQSLAASRKGNNPAITLMGIQDLSNLYAESGDFKKALEIGLEALRMPESVLINLYKAQIYERLTQLSIELKDWNSAQKYLNDAFKYCKIIQLNDYIYECYRNQSKIDSAQGNYQSALKNYKIFAALKDSVYQTQYYENIATLTAKYDLESKQKTITLLEKDQKIQQGQIRQQQTLMLIGLLLVLMVMLGVRLNNQRKTQQLKTAFAQDLLKVQETERQRISKDLHDSVGQNLLFIKNQLHRLAPLPSQQLFSSVDSTLEEVRNIAKDLYPNQLEQYGLQSAVDSLCETTQATSGIFVSSDLQGIDAKLNREAKINFYRIIQECINNAMKHANATSIRITSNQSPGKLELVVQDNGKGFDKSILEHKAQRSFGILNMEERIKMLRGKFDLETAVDQGVKLTFSIPV
jgi:signal transduction histidine kinase